MTAQKEKISLKQLKDNIIDQAALFIVRIEECNSVAELVVENETYRSILTKDQLGLEFLNAAIQLQPDNYIVE